MATTFILATRGSDLALAQSGRVADLLREAGLDVRLEVVRTEGDVTTESLSRLGGRGVFAAAIRLALLDGRAHLAVHSFKDLPTAPVAGLTVAAVPPRATWADALCAADEASLTELPHGARVGTGSPRRAAQLLALRPDLEIVDIRGNVPTRLGRVADSPLDGPHDLDAVVLALAGLERLGLAYAATDVFGPDRLLPAPAQGALAVEAPLAALAAHPDLAQALTALDDPWSRAAATAERQVLATLDAGCAAPVGAWAQRSVDEDGAPLLALDAAVVATDGSRSVSAMAARPIDAEARDATVVAGSLGQAVAEQLLDLGAADVADLTATRNHREER